ncbi:MAG TPA: hypothetical protein VGI92_03740 [Gemmatimonadales bacterium]
MINNRILMTLILAPLALAGCSRSDRSAQGAGRTPLSDTVPQAARQPDPVITDTRSIYAAHGLANGPPWTVDLFGQGIRYKGPGRENGVVFGPGRVDGNDSASSWVSKRMGPAPNSIIIEFRRLNCTDGHSDTTYRYQVRLTVDGTQYRGCASGGPPDATPAPPAARGRPHQP